MSLPRIAVDAMGGDEGVRVMVEGAALARRRHDRFKFLLVGDETRIKSALENHPNLRGFLERVQARPAYQAALAQGGPFALAGARA